jgi:phage-related protein
VNEDDFQAKLDKCSTEQERQALITGTLNGLYADSANAYKENNAEVINANKAQDMLNATLAKVGGLIEPFITKGKVLLAEVLSRLTPALEWIANKALPWVGTAISNTIKWFGNLTSSLGSSGISFRTVLDGVRQVFSGAMTFIQGVWNTVGQPVWNYIKQAVNLVAGLFKQHMPAIKEFVRQAFTDIRNIWQNNLQPALQAIGNFINNVLAPAFKFVFENVIAPVVGNAFNSIKQLWNGSLKPVLQGILDFITGVFTLNFQKAFSGLVSVIGGIWSGLKTAVKTPINGVISVINSFISGLNRLKIPSWIPGIGGNGINIPTIPLLAEGAVLEKGQTGFLEGNGAEAVVPLHNNKKWISAVAQDMAQSGIGGGASSQELLEAFLAFVAELPDVLADAFGGMSLDVNRREFARLVKAVN